MLVGEQLGQLATFDPVPFPVISLYLNTAADQHGPPHFRQFVRPVRLECVQRRLQEKNNGKNKPKAQQASEPADVSEDWQTVRRSKKPKYPLRYSSDACDQSGRR